MTTKNIYEIISKTLSTEKLNIIINNNVLCTPR